MNKLQLRQKLRQMIREEIKHIISEQELEEGVIKNLALAALLSLPGISSVQAQAVQQPEKPVNVVTVDNNQLKFKDFETFHQHFVKNINEFKNLKGERKFNVVINNVIYEGVVGIPSRDMQMALDKIPGNNQEYRNVHKDGNMFVGYKLFKRYSRKVTTMTLRGR